MKQVLIDISEKRYGRWVVLSRADNREKRAYWVCKCDCGTVKEVSGKDLRNGKSLSCGCFNKECVSLPENVALGYKVHRAYAKSAKARGLFFGIDKDTFVKLILKPCGYCGEKYSNILQLKEHPGLLRYNGLDRIDSKKGYILDNLTPCCKTCNRMKSTFSVEDWKKHMERILKYSGGSCE